MVLQLCATVHISGKLTGSGSYKRLYWDPRAMIPYINLLSLMSILNTALPSLMLMVTHIYELRSIVLVSQKDTDSNMKTIAGAIVYSPYRTPCLS